jgi:NTE family protein
MQRSRVTLALGGGGARGVAHLGVIEVLLDAGFLIDRVVGVSSGSLAGSLYCYSDDIAAAKKQALDYLLSEKFQQHQQVLFGVSPGPDDEEGTGGVFSWYERVKGYLRANRMFHRVLRQPSLLPGVVLQDVVEHLLPDADLTEARVPISVVAVDLRSGHKVVLERGPLRDSVRASSSLPGIFPPVEIGDLLLCDVGVFDSLPTTVARSYNSDYVIAVDVSSRLRPVTHCDTALDVLMRMDEIGESLFRKHVREAAHLIVHPDVADVEWFDFSQSEKVIEAGRVAARRALANFHHAEVTT